MFELQKKYKILSVCGAGVATCTMIAEAIKERLKKKGFTNVEVIKDRIDKIMDKNPDEIDLIISSNPIPPDIARGVPVFRTMSFLTGIGVEKDIEEIVKKLKSI